MVNLYDFFTTGATADLTTHTPDSGTSWVVQVAGGTIQVVSGNNFARENNNANGNRYKLSDDIGTSAMTVEGDFTSTQAATTFLGVAAQLPNTTGSTATEFYWDQATGQWQLTDGTLTATLTETWPGGTVHIMLRCETGILSGYANGKLKVRLNSTANSGTRAGIIMGNFGGGATGASTCDNFHAGPTVPLAGTTTSTSSTSSTTVSTSSTSSSTSHSSTSFSSTSTSASTSSTSMSTSSTSSSISSTSSSTSSTSMSSTSSSTSISSTSSSISSTSQSSTSQSSTSSSSSVSSTSSSFSSTSSSQSSTSRSTSSTSFSSTSSSSSTSTTTVPGFSYSYGDLSDLPNIKVVQRANFFDTAGSAGLINVVLPAPATKGNTIIALLAGTDTSLSLWGTEFADITDSQSNSYTKVFDQYTATYQVGWKIFWATVGASGPLTVKETNDTNNPCILYVYEVSGLAASPFDTSANQAYTAGTASFDSTNATTTVGDELLIGAFVSGLAGAPTWTPGTGFTNIQQRANSSALASATEEKIVHTAEAYNATATSTLSTQGGLAVIVSFKAGSTTPPNAFTPLNYNNATGDDGDYFIEYGSEIMVQQYKRTNTNNTDKPTFTWKGRTTYDTRISPIIMQIYNVNSASWETFMVDNTVPADTDYQCSYTQSTNVSNYYDSNNTVSFRVYQKVI